MDNFLDAPVIEPFRRLLRSRRFTTAIVAVLVAALVSMFPGLEEINTELFVIIATSAVALIGGYSWEDSATAARVNSETADLNLRNTITEAVTIAVSEIDFVIEDEIVGNPVGSAVDDPTVYSIE